MFALKKKILTYKHLALKTKRRPFTKDYCQTGVACLNCMKRYLQYDQLMPGSHKLLSQYVGLEETLRNVRRNTAGIG